MRSFRIRAILIACLITSASIKPADAQPTLTSQTLPDQLFEEKFIQLQALYRDLRYCSVTFLGFSSIKEVAENKLAKLAESIPSHVLEQMTLKSAKLRVDVDRDVLWCQSQKDAFLETVGDEEVNDGNASKAVTLSLIEAERRATPKS
jgi:hypothetical protein